MKIKQLILLMCFLPVAFSATPDFDVRFNLNKSIEYEETNVGTMFLLENGYLSNTVVVDNFTDVTISQYDKISWNGSSSIDILRGDNIYFLQPGNERLFNRQGRFEAVSIRNSSDSFNITVVEPPKHRINLDYISDDIDVGFSSDSFIINNEKAINITLDADDNLMPDSYEVIFKVMGENITKNYSVDFNIPLLHTYLIENETLKTNYSVEAGEVDELGIIKFKNTGNSNFDISTDVTGNITDFISTQDSLTLYQMNTVAFQVYSQIPLKQKSGIFKGDIIFSIGNNTLKRPMMFNVTDKTNPRINNISMNNLTVFKHSNVKILAEDNVVLDKCNFTVDDREFIEEFDGKTCEFEIQFNKSGEYVGTMRVYDFNGNFNETETEFTIKKLNSTSRLTRLHMPTVKAGKHSKRLILNLTQDITKPINFTMFDYYTDTQNISLNEDFFVEFEYGDGDYTKLDDFDDVVSVYEKGEIYIKIKNVNVTEFEGELIVDFPIFLDVDDYNTAVKIEGKSASYSLPEPFTKAFAGGHEIMCDVDDTGDLETSMYDCDFKYNIQGGESDNVMIPISIHEWERVKEETEEVESELKSKIFTRNMMIGAAIFIIIILGFVATIITRAAPVTRIIKLS